jgi:prepilin-type processing-associated H-X9-DG protein
LDDGLYVPYYCANASNPNDCLLIDMPSFAHNDGATFTFADGHTKWVKGDRFLTKPIDPAVLNMFDWRLPHPIVRSAEAVFWCP